jgi:hypothetical protein
MLHAQVRGQRAQVEASGVQLTAMQVARQRRQPTTVAHVDEPDTQALREGRQPGTAAQVEPL